jgi:predicted outer membrane repeat protein
MSPRHTLLVISAVLGTAATASRSDAGVIRVNRDGSGDAATVQGGIDLALSGDTVLVAAGTYEELLALEGKGILLRGESGPGSVVLDGNYAGRILTVSSPDTPVILEDLDFEYGRMQGVDTNNQGGAIASFAARLVVRNCAFRNNLASSLGAGIYASALPPFEAPGGTAVVPALEVTGSLFESNFCGGDGGGIFADGVGATIDDCTFRQNTGGGTGGGIGLLHGSHAVSGSVFDGNHATSGAGIAFSGTGTLRIEDCVFRQNIANNLGGGCFVVSAFGLELAGTDFVDNRAFRGAGGAFELVPVTGERVYWLGNVAEERGGGVYASGGSLAVTAATWLLNQAAHGASFTVLDVGVSLERTILGDPAADAVDCHGASSVTGGCLVATATTGACTGLPISARLSVAPCSGSLDSLCTVPVLPDCGAIGHAQASCTDECASAARPLSWGRLKDLFR